MLELSLVQLFPRSDMDFLTLQTGEHAHRLPGLGETYWAPTPTGMGRTLLGVNVNRDLTPSCDC